METKKIITGFIAGFIVAAIIITAGCIGTDVEQESVESTPMEIEGQEFTSSSDVEVEKEPDHGRPRSIREEHTLVIVGPDQPVEEEEEREFSVAVEWLMNHAHMSFTVGAPEEAPEDKSVVVAWLMNNVHMGFTNGAPEQAPEDKSPAVAWLMNHVYTDTTPKEQKDTIVGTPNMNSQEKSSYGFNFNRDFGINEPVEDPWVYEWDVPETRLPTQGELEFGIAPHDEDRDPGCERDRTSKPEEPRDDRPEPTSKNVNTGGGW